ncbi:MAG: hypothetical protein R3A48_23190 [Polyangiales bacterium]
MFPERHTVWFARGAVLQLEPDVVVIFRGSLRAENTMIFDLPEVRARRSMMSVPANLGTASVRFESTRIEEIYPEWFGVRSVAGGSFVAPNDASANTAAYQACLHAACRDRDRHGVSLPPLTIISRGIFSLNDTLEARPDVNGRAALWLAGNGDSTRRGKGIPTLTRFSRAARPAGVQAGTEVEDHRSAVLRLHPQVSGEISGVGFKVVSLRRGEKTPHDVAHALLIEEFTTEGTVAAPPGRHVIIERSGLVGAREAVIAVRARSRGPNDLSRGVGATIPVPPSPGAIGLPGPLGLPSEFPSLFRAGLPRRATYYAMRECAIDAVLEGYVPSTPNDPANPSTPVRSSRYAVDLDVPAGGLAELTSVQIYQVKPSVAYFNDRGAPFDFVDLEAGVRVVGLPLFVRAASFHLGEGPRPSRPAPSGSAPDMADGQDLWLAQGDLGIAPHVTVAHADSQSWWFLGGEPLSRVAPGAVSLLNVGAGDVNRTQLVVEEGMRFTSAPSTDGLQAFRLHTPPSVLWPRSATPLLLLACAFRRYCVRRDMSSVVLNMGTCFFGVTEVSLNSWLPAESVPRPLPGDFLAGIRDGRVIDPAVRLDRSRDVTELPLLIDNGPVQGRAIQ